MSPRASLPLLALCLAALLVSTPLLLRAEEAPEAPATARGYPGFHLEPLAILSDAQKAELGVTADHGSVVAFVLPDGPAAKAGLRVGDFAIRWDGENVPDVTNPDRYEPGHHAWRVAIREHMERLVAGTPTRLEVRRGDETLTITVPCVSEADIHAAMGGTDVPVPAPAAAGTPKAYAFGFEGLAADAVLPAGFLPDEGHWHVAASAPGCASPVLVQDHPVLPWAVLLATGPGRSFEDGRVSVRFQPVSGVVDASGGIVFRAQDARNYYVARANALEDNWNLYIVKDGTRTTLAQLRVDPPPMGTWHTMEVRFSGDAFEAILDGKYTVKATDATFRSGWCGLWTKADSVTRFDDLTCRPEAQ